MLLYVRNVNICYSICVFFSNSRWNLPMLLYYSFLEVKHRRRHYKHDMSISACLNMKHLCSSINSCQLRCVKEKQIQGLIINTTVKIESGRHTNNATSVSRYQCQPHTSLQNMEISHRHIAVPASACRVWRSQSDGYCGNNYTYRLRFNIVLSGKNYLSFLV